MAPAALQPHGEPCFGASVSRRLLGDLAALPGLAGTDAHAAGRERAWSAEHGDRTRRSHAERVDCPERTRIGRPRALQFPGLPTGTLDAAAGYAAAAATLLAPEAIGVTEQAARAAVLLPLVLADAEARPRPQRSRPRTLGTATVCADLATADDEDLLARLLATISASERADPERVATLAQSWRLPVLPYRSRAAADALRASEAGVAAVVRVAAAGAACAAGSRFRLARGARPFAGLTVCDLSTMWAGPLATAMLRALGAEVVKIEMPTRPDGMRRAFGADRSSASGAGVFAALNSGKRLLRLDLRHSGDRARFERLLASSDVLVESFSRRVLPNLGYDEQALRAIQPGLLVAAVRAFPPGASAAWVAYGAGIHAASGLADLGPGRFGAASVSYPDPLAGIALFAAVTGQVLARERSGEASAAEVSLWDAVRPLLDLPQPGLLEQEPSAERLRRFARLPARAPAAIAASG